MREAHRRIGPAGVWHGLHVQASAAVGEGSHWGPHLREHGRRNRFGEAHVVFAASFGEGVDSVCSCDHVDGILVTGVQEWPSVVAEQSRTMSRTDTVGGSLSIRVSLTPALRIQE